MTNPLADARTALGLLLANVGVPVHTIPPGTPTGPFIALLPDSPWLDPRGHVRFLVAVCAPTTNNTAALERVEQTTYDALVALQAGSGVGISEIQAPTIDTTAALLTALIPVVMRTF